MNNNPSSSSTLTSHRIYWIVAGITFLTLLVSAGIRSTPGVLIIPFEQSIAWNFPCFSPICFGLYVFRLIYFCCLLWA